MGIIQNCNFRLIPGFLMHSHKCVTHIFTPNLYSLILKKLRILSLSNLYQTKIKNDLLISLLHLGVFCFVCFLLNICKRQMPM